MSRTAEDRKRWFINSAILTSRGLIARKNIDVNLYASALRSSKGYLSLLKTFVTIRRETRDTKETELLLHLTIFYAGMVFGRGEAQSLSQKQGQQTPAIFRSSEKSIAGQAF